ncbi:MAG: hypothetical protein JNK21_11755 [Rhodospirillaceae bacterium]|nr:hypothetical protein [Rhodospirillaceae bacterium]
MARILAGSARAIPARRTPTVELSIAATSEELEILAAAAQRRHMTLKDFLRIQLVSAAKAAAKPEPESPAKAPRKADLEHNGGALTHAFLP